MSELNVEALRKAIGFFRGMSLRPKCDYNCRRAVADYRDGAFEITCPDCGFHSVSRDAPA